MQQLSGVPLVHDTLHIEPSETTELKADRFMNALVEPAVILHYPH
jgi:hypothetical protein